MKRLSKTLFAMAAAVMLLLSAVQVPAVSSDCMVAAVLNPDICAVQATPAAPEPAAVPSPVPAPPVQTAVPSAVLRTDADVVPAAADVTPEPQFAQPVAVSAQSEAAEPKVVLPGIIYDEANEILYGPNGKGLIYSGFDFDIHQNVFYASLDCWQKAFGYNNFYDAAAPFGAMLFDTRSIYFSYDGRDWMVKLWKGQYGITSGAEVGIYTKSTVIASQYKGVEEEDFVMMDLTVYRNNELYFFREPQMHWWLSGFVVGDFTAPADLGIVTNITFKDPAMAEPFIAALCTQEDTQDVDYTVDGSTTNLTWH